MTTSHSQTKAILYAIAGFTCYVLCDAAIKIAGTSPLPNYEIVACLGLVIAASMLIYGLATGSVRKLWPNRPGRVILRSLLDVCNNLFVVVALRHLSLTLFYILVFTSPMIVAVLAWLFLREKLDMPRVAAILVGFVGVVIAVHPTTGIEHSEWVGIGACVICVACFSTAIVWGRSIAQAETPQAMSFASGFVAAIVGLGGMAHKASPVSSHLLIALLVMGLLGAIGNIFMFTALRMTTAATVSQYHYSQLVSGALVAYLIFHEAPTIWMALGASLIIAAGLYVASRHRDSPPA